MVQNRRGCQRGIYLQLPGLSVGLKYRASLPGFAALVSLVFVTRRLKEVSWAQDWWVSGRRLTLSVWC
jgi:hypothetical protein